VFYIQGLNIAKLMLTMPMRVLG